MPTCFTKALDAMGKLDDAMFGNVPPDDTESWCSVCPGVEDARGPWNEGPDFDYMKIRNRKVVFRRRPLTQMMSAKVGPVRSLRRRQLRAVPTTRG